MPNVCLLVPVFAVAFQASLFERLWVQGQDQLKLAEYTQATQTLQTAIAAGKKAGIDDLLLALATNDLAEAYSRLGEYDSAESQYSRAVEILRKGPQSWRLVIVLNNQARLYRDLGLDLRSASTFWEAREIAKKARIENTPVVAAALSGLAEGLSSQGDLRGAKRYLQQSLRIREASLGAEHPDVAETLNNLGVLYAKMKRYSEAEAIFRRALNVNQRLLGAAHPDVAVTLDNLGVLDYERKRYAEAENFIRQALEIRKKHFPTNHSTIARSLTHLANVLISTKRSLAAEELLKEAAAIREMHPTGLDAESAATLESYALALRLNGHAGDASAIEAQVKFLRAKLKYVVRR
jgi:tetratricopeptide (TPR) repeat protein